MDTLLLTVPPYIVSVILMALNNWSSERLWNSSFHIIWPLVLPIAGYVIAAASILPCCYSLGAVYTHCPFPCQQVSSAWRECCYIGDEWCE